MARRHRRQPLKHEHAEQPDDAHHDDPQPGTSLRLLRPVRRRRWAYYPPGRPALAVCPKDRWPPTNGGSDVRFKASGRVKTRSMPKLSMLTLAVGLLALAGCGSSSRRTTSSATET